MYVANNTVHVEASDQCAKCHYFSQGVACPLLEALCLGVVSLNDEITVSNCGFYKPFERRLQIVGEDLPASDRPAPSTPNNIRAIGGN